MKKSLSDKLARYGSLAAGIVGTTAAQGQILYTDLSPGITIDEDSLFFFDLNQDSINDFAIRSRFDYQLGISVFDEISALPLNNTGSRIAGDVPMSYPYASKFDFNVDIDQDTEWLGPLVEGSLLFARNGNFDYNDYWNGGDTDKFLGLRLALGDSMHYGWARLDVHVTSNGISYTLKDFAVNLKANEAINTSHLVSVDKHNEMAFIVSQQGQEIWIKADVLQSEATVELFDVQGRVVYSDRILPRAEMRISTIQYRSGMYILRFYNQDGLKERKVIIR
jgi:hypothetical protein